MSTIPHLNTSEPNLQPRTKAALELTAANVDDLDIRKMVSWACMNDLELDLQRKQKVLLHVQTLLLSLAPANEVATVLLLAVSAELHSS